MGDFYASINTTKKNSKTQNLLEINYLLE